MPQSRARPEQAVARLDLALALARIYHNSAELECTALRAPEWESWLHVADAAVRLIRPPQAAAERLVRRPEEIEAATRRVHDDFGAVWVDLLRARSIAAERTGSPPCATCLPSATKKRPGDTRS